MRQILESLPPVFEMLVFILFFMLLFSMLGACFALPTSNFDIYFKELVLGIIGLVCQI